MRLHWFVFLLFCLPAVSQTAFEKSEKQYKQENYALAKSGFETLFKQNPDDPKTLKYLGEIACRMKSFDKALFYFERLKKIRPNQADCYYLYGGALALKAKSVSKIRALGMIDDIRESFEKAIALNPKHIEARWALIEYYLQLPGIFGGSEEKALEYSNELLQISPVDGYLSKGHIAEYSKQYKEAEKNYLKAIDEGHSFTAYKKLAFLYKDKMKMPEKGKTILEAYSKREKIKS